MHRTSKNYMRKSFEKHISPLPKGTVLDVGSMSLRGDYREIWEGEGGWTYHGCDLIEGPNVDVKLDDPWVFPIADETYDAVISGQMLEHNEFFWLTFLEMARVLKPGGMMVHIVPSRGAEHRDPQDCWRFYRDGMTALAKWSGLEVVEATTDWSSHHFAYWEQRKSNRVKELRKTMRKKDTVWGDTVGVLRKVAPFSETQGMDYIRKFAARA